MMVAKFPELIKDNNPRFGKTKPKQDFKKYTNTKARKKDIKRRYQNLKYNFSKSNPTIYNKYNKSRPVEFILGMQSWHSKSINIIHILANLKRNDK